MVAGGDQGVNLQAGNHKTVDQAAQRAQQQTGGDPPTCFPSG
jgi:hypothetical protein